MRYKLSNLFQSLGMSDSQIADEVQKMSGEIITRQLVTNALDGQAIPALKAQAICMWLSKEFAREIKPEDISDLKIHAFSAFPADTGESAAFKSEKIAGFMAGFRIVYEARERNQELSSKSIDRMVIESAKTNLLPGFQEGMSSQRRGEAYKNASRFAISAVQYLLRDHPQAQQKYQEWRSWLPIQRQKYAREMAETYLEYL